MLKAIIYSGDTKIKILKKCKGREESNKALELAARLNLKIAVYCDGFRIA